MASSVGGGGEVEGGGRVAGGDWFSLVDRNCVQCKMAAGICSICAYQNNWYTVSVVQSSLPVYMQPSRVRKMSTGTVGRFKEGAEGGNSDSCVEKYPELEMRVFLLHGMGVPLAVTTMSRVREVRGDQGIQEEVDSMFTSVRSCLDMLSAS